MKCNFLLSLLICILSHALLFSQDLKHVAIGNQTWMSENLSVDKFRNGDVIKEVKTPEEWYKAIELKIPAWCYPGQNLNDGSYKSDNPNKGKIYNYYAVTDKRGLAPSGWHIPSSNEFNDLVKKLGGESIASSKLKSNSGWSHNGTNINGSNESGFNAIPTGLLDDGYFMNETDFASFWTSTKSSEGLDVFQIYIDTKNNHTVESSFGWGQRFGLTVRLIKDNILAPKIDEKVTFWNSKSTLTASDCELLFADYLVAKENNLIDQAISLISINSTKCNSNDEMLKISSLRSRAELYALKSDYPKAIADLKTCESRLVKFPNEDFLIMSIYDKLSDCYLKSGDNSNYKLYKDKSKKVWDSHQEKLNSQEDIDTENGKNRKFCFSNYSGKYEVTLFEDGSKNVIYKLYNVNGVLQKTIQGTWEMRDEGVYGPAYKITISWTGSNSSLPDTKYVCQFDGGGILQNIIDNENRTWIQCY